MDRIPAAETLCPGDHALGTCPRAARPRDAAACRPWLRSSVTEYADQHDDLAGDDTSRMSPYLHFGCLSPTELVASAGRSRGACAFVRQLAWRDFNLQLLATPAGRSPTGTSATAVTAGVGTRTTWQPGRTGGPATRS